MRKNLLSLLLIPLMFMFFIGTSFAIPAAPVLSYEVNGVNIAISWTAVPGASSYTLYYSPSLAAESIESVTMGGNTSFAVDLFAGAAYYIAVTASDGSGEGPYSNIEHFVMAPPVPDAPLLTVATDGLNISLSWTEVPAASGYRLYFSADTNPESFASIDLGDEDQVSYYLWEGAAYYLKVTAYNASGSESEPSNMEYFVMGPPNPEWLDADGDGFTPYQGDCDDSEQGVNPAAEEICGDAIDQDCTDGDAICEMLPVDELEFTDNGDGTLTQSGTNLMWQQSYVVPTDVHENMEVINWYSAADACQFLKLAGFSDWRLPTIEELEGIVDSRQTTQINPLFAAPEQTTYWSYTYWSTTERTAYSVYDMDFNTGARGVTGKQTTSVMARCVRDAIH